MLGLKSVRRFVFGAYDVPAAITQTTPPWMRILEKRRTHTYINIQHSTDQPEHKSHSLHLHSNSHVCIRALSEAEHENEKQKKKTKPANKHIEQKAS